MSEYGDRMEELEAQEMATDYYNNRIDSLQQQLANNKSHLHEADRRIEALEAFLYKIKKADEPWSMEDLQELLDK